MKTVFIFGIGGFNHIKVSYLPKEVCSQIDYYMSNNYYILVGDCQGVDTLIQNYLNEHSYYNVTVYHSGSKCRNKANLDWLDVSVLSNKTGRDFYTAKDIVACKYTNQGFAIWDGVSIGTKRNIDQLNDEGKSVLTYRIDKGCFCDNELSLFD